MSASRRIAPSRAGKTLCERIRKTPLCDLGRIGDAGDRCRTDDARAHQPGAPRSHGRSRAGRHRSQRGIEPRHDLGGVQAAAGDERDAAHHRPRARFRHAGAQLLLPHRLQRARPVSAHGRGRLRRLLRGRKHRLERHDRHVDDADDHRHGDAALRRLRRRGARPSVEPARRQFFGNRQWRRERPVHGLQCDARHSGFRFDRVGADPDRRLLRRFRDATTSIRSARAATA